MRATIQNYLEAAKARREEEGNDKGFSLVELIVVIVVIGILIAVAFPIFGAVQQNAKIGALESAAAEGATVAASEWRSEHAVAALDAASSLAAITASTQLATTRRRPRLTDLTTSRRAVATGANDPAGRGWLRGDPAPAASRRPSSRWGRRVERRPQRN